MISALMVVVIFVPLLLLLLLLLVLEGQWKSGILYSVAVGFLQDQICKLAPGQPAAYSALVLLAFLLACLLIVSQIQNLSLGRVFFGNQQVIRILGFFLLLLGVQSLHSWLRFGSVQLRPRDSTTTWPPFSPLGRLSLWAGTVWHGSLVSALPEPYRPIHGVPGDFLPGPGSPSV